MRDDDIVAIVHWKTCKDSHATREMISYARAHGFLNQDEGVLRSVVITGCGIFLLSQSVGLIARKMGQT